MKKLPLFVDIVAIVLVFGGTYAMTASEIKAGAAALLVWMYGSLCYLAGQVSLSARDEQ